MSVRLLRGDCRVTLPALEAQSVQAAVTSPPYFGLRSYGTPDLVWGGDREHTHEWGSVGRAFHPGQVPQTKWANVSAVADGGRAGSGTFCLCGAWLGSLGLEPAPELFVAHLVECFREVRRVLRDDGVLWVNMGDSMSGSGNGSNDHRQNGKHYRKGVGSISLNADKYQGQKPGLVENLPAKNLMMMPSRVAMALQDDGWILRAMIPWLKRAAMPESVTDRPSSAVEYWFLFSKQARYFWDADAVRQPHTHKVQRYLTSGRKDVPPQYGAGGSKIKDHRNYDGVVQGNPAGRNRRNSDWFFESWQGLMLGEDDAPMSMIVNPSGYSGAHFATFPPKLVEPMVKASSRPGDTILDPFAGAGTTLMVADRLGRNAIGCELSSEYSDLGSDRLIGDAPMFVELESA